MTTKVTVTDQHHIRAPLDAVYGCFWDATCWPEITPHVRRIEMLEADETHQRMLMTVEAKDRMYTVESVRDSVPGRSIRYRQTRPPAFLTEHDGEWLLEQTPSGILVRLRHHAAIDMDKALEALGVATAEEAVAEVRHTLKTNGERTILAVKRHLESRTPETG